jgi:hypothetical protein
VLAMNPDKLEPGERRASTSNRNFEGRQGFKGPTYLVSPTMAAAAAIEGHFVDIRNLPVGTRKLIPLVCSVVQRGGMDPVFAVCGPETVARESGNDDAVGLSFAAGPRCKLHRQPNRSSWSSTGSPASILDSGAKRNALKRSGFERPFQARHEQPCRYQIGGVLHFASELRT